jgi:uncharacterized phiE125 gp8 family phage protein
MYSLSITQSGFAVSLADAKMHLRVDHSTEDDLITRLIHAATEMAQSFTGRQIRSATSTLKLPRFPVGREPLYLPRPPLVDFAQVYYWNSSGTGTEYTINVNNYNAGDESFIEPDRGSTWPSVDTMRTLPVKVQYSHGYENTDAVPELIKQAILLMVGHLYENREAATTGKIDTIPLGFHDLLMPYVVGDHFREFEPNDVSEDYREARSHA